MNLLKDPNLRNRLKKTPVAKHEENNTVKVEVVKKVLTPQDLERMALIEKQKLDEERQNLIFVITKYLY